MKLSADLRRRLSCCRPLCYPTGVIRRRMCRRFAAGFCLTLLIGLIGLALLWFCTDADPKDRNDFIAHNLTFTIAHIGLFPAAAGLLAATFRQRYLKRLGWRWWLIPPIAALLVGSFLVLSAGQVPLGRPHPVELLNPRPAIDAMKTLTKAQEELADYNKVMDSATMQDPKQLPEWEKGRHLKRDEFNKARSAYFNAVPEFKPGNFSKFNCIPWATNGISVVLVSIPALYFWYLIVLAFKAQEGRRIDARTKKSIHVIFFLITIWIPLRFYADWHQNHILAESDAPWYSLNPLRLTAAVIALFAYLTIIVSIFFPKALAVVLSAAAVILTIIAMLTSGWLPALASKIDLFVTMVFALLVFLLCFLLAAWSAK